VREGSPLRRGEHGETLTVFQSTFDIDCPLTDPRLLGFEVDSNPAGLLLSLEGTVTVGTGKRRVRLHTAVLLFAVEWLTWLREMMNGSRETCRFFGKEASWRVRRQRRRAEIEWTPDAAAEGARKYKVRASLQHLAAVSVDSGLGLVRRLLEVDDDLQDLPPVQDLLHSLRETKTALTAYEAATAPLPVRLMRAIRSRRGRPGGWVAAGLTALVVAQSLALLGLWRRVEELRREPVATPSLGASPPAKPQAGGPDSPELPPPASIPGGQPAQPAPRADARGYDATGAPSVDLSGGATFGAVVPAPLPPPGQPTVPQGTLPAPVSPRQTSAKLVGVIETETEKLALLEHDGRTDKLRKGDTLTTGASGTAEWRVIWITAQSVQLEGVSPRSPGKAPARVALTLGEEARLR